MPHEPKEARTEARKYEALIKEKSWDMWQFKKHILKKQTEKRRKKNNRFHQ